MRQGTALYSHENEIIDPVHKKPEQEKIRLPFTVERFAPDGFQPPSAWSCRCLLEVFRRAGHYLLLLRISSFVETCFKSFDASEKSHI